MHNTKPIVHATPAKKSILILGAGKTGKSVAKFLCHYNDTNYRIYNDPHPGYKYNDHEITQLLSGIDTIIASPGIKPNHDLLRASVNSIKITNDLDLFYNTHPDCKYYAITGSNGKSTTTALINHIIEKAALAILMAGNIGTPICNLDPLYDCNNYDFLLEISSYQARRIQNMQFAQSLLINIVPDHLEWHQTMDDYIDAKLQLLQRSAMPLLCIDDEHTQKIARDWPQSASPLMTISSIPNRHADFQLVDNKIVHDNQVIVDLTQCDNTHLSGQHNLQNILCASVFAWLLAIPANTIITAINSFAGLPFRQQYVTTINNIAIINDSKATSIQATITALQRFDNIIWLAGGVAKENNLIAANCPDLPHDKIRHSIFWGRDKAQLQGLANHFNIGNQLCENMQQALQIACDYAKTQPTNMTILLSPACASFDQFNDFEARGQQFNQMVRQIFNDNDRNNNSAINSLMELNLFA